MFWNKQDKQDELSKDDIKEIMEVSMNTKRLEFLSKASDFKVTALTGINAGDYRVEYLRDEDLYADISPCNIEYYVRTSSYQGFDVEININNLMELKAFCEFLTEVE